MARRDIPTIKPVLANKKKDAPPLLTVDIVSTKGIAVGEAVGGWMAVPETIGRGEGVLSKILAPKYSQHPDLAIRFKKEHPSSVVA